MKTIEERAKTRGAEPLTEEDVKVLHNVRGALSAFEVGYILGATEQKAIDDAELARLKKAWEKEAEVNHDVDMSYKQGYHDAIDKACEWLRARNVLTAASLEGFKKAMEE